MESYLTVLSTGSWEQTVEKSRFIALVFPVKSVQDVEKSLEKARLIYPNARHYVYAYRLYEGRLEKATDDGEPQGTGGRPVLDVLQYRNLWDVLLVVVRYFGGILLGTGGLTRAYGGTARELMDRMEITQLVPHAAFEVEASYGWYEPLKYQFRQNHWVTGTEDFAASVRMEVFIPFEEKQKFIDWLAEFTERQVVCREKGIVLRSKSLGSRR